MFKQLSRIEFAALFGYLLFGALAGLVLFLLPPLVLGDPGVNRLVVAVTSTDLRVWIALLLVATWLPPLLVMVLIRRFLWDHPLRQRLFEMVRERTVPIDVEVKQLLPIEFGEALQTPVDLRTSISIDKEVEIVTEIPVNTHLDIDTTVQTKVLGIGTIKIPIQSSIPIELIIPIKKKIRITIDDLPINIRETIAVKLPRLEVPLDTRLQTKIHLFGG